MPMWERVIAVLLTALAVALGVFLIYRSYLYRTVAVPIVGGVYEEAMVGEVKTLNPVLVTTDAEKSISSLIFPGLISVGSNGEILPDLAERWEIGKDEKTYTFYLRNGITFDDGTPLSPSDVSYTVSNILSDSLKSPLAANLKGVTVSYDLDQNSVTFNLPNSYGPFIYNCNFGIIPANVDPVTFSKRFTGAGKYKFTKGIQTDNKITQVQLQSNSNYYGVAPYIQKLTFDLYTTEASAVAAFGKNRAVSAIFGAEAKDAIDRSYNSQKELILFANTRKASLSTKAGREKLFGQTDFDAKATFTITAQDNDIQRAVAEKEKAALQKKNVSIQVRYLSLQDYQAAINSKDFELLVYGYDRGYDRDPYAFWHSSQKDLKNFSGYSDKATDILIEDARMLLDVNARNAKYDQIYAKLQSEYLYQTFDPIKYKYFVKSEIKAVADVRGNIPGSRFADISNWYIMEKRVKKVSDL